MTRKMPEQKPGISKQDVGTPPEFLQAVARRFGPIRWDLAAHARNSVSGDRFYGPGSRWGDNTFERAWDRIPSVVNGHDLLWFNPEFGNMEPAARKVAGEAERGARVALLAPLSAADWAIRYIWGRALVLPLFPRLTFVGHTAPFPKDLALAVYAADETPRAEPWRWLETQAAVAAGGAP